MPCELDGPLQVDEGEDSGMKRGEFLEVLIRLNRCIAHARRQNGKFEFSARSLRK